MRPRWNSHQLQGILAALASAVVLGLSPVFGKQAINEGASWLTVVMLRTVAATALLWVMYLLTPGLRRFTYIYPVGLAGCLAAGLINGVGSLMYYNSLSRIDASLGQLIYMLYPLFLAVLSQLDGYEVSRFTLFRLGLALMAVYLLVGLGVHNINGLGVLLMLGGSLMYALHLVVNQRTLVDMPAPTVALYTLTAMSVTTLTAFFAEGRPAMPPTPLAWQAVGLLALATLLSRLTLFTGVKHLGGVQAGLISLSELLITVIGARVLLGEQLSPLQWLGAGLLGLSVGLITRESSLGAPQQPKPWLKILTARFTPPTLTPPTPPVPVKPPVSKGE